MLGIQSQPSFATSKVQFRGQVSDLKYDIETERDEKIDQYKRDQAEWNDFADTLEKSDNKVAKKASKLVRLGATALGLVGTFIGAKYGSKFAIETFKSLTKSGTGKAIVDGVKGMEQPLKKTASSIGEALTKVAETPVIKSTVEKIKNTSIGKKATEILTSEKAGKILEPVKNTFKSIKDIKIDGGKIQNYIENTMAAISTGSVLVDDLAGRNNNKSATELAAGI